MGLGGTSRWEGRRRFFTVVRRSGVLSLYMDGVLEASATRTQDISGNYVTQVGASTGFPTIGHMPGLALIRAGVTLPSDEQIAKIYRDELALFQPNAACTLYGTSDIVTALASDPITGLVHSGGPAGRSDFAGLVRVSNTTTPVTTAIAAHGGMIVEQ